MWAFDFLKLFPRLFRESLNLYVRPKRYLRESSWRTSPTLLHTFTVFSCFVAAIVTVSSLILTGTPLAFARGGYTPEVVILNGVEHGSTGPNVRHIQVLGSPGYPQWFFVGFEAMSTAASPNQIFDRTYFVVGQEGSGRLLDQLTLYSPTNRWALDRLTFLPKEPLEDRYVPSVDLAVRKIMYVVGHGSYVYGLYQPRFYIFGISPDLSSRYSPNFITTPWSDRVLFEPSAFILGYGLIAVDFGNLDPKTVPSIFYAIYWGSFLVSAGIVAAFCFRSERGSMIERIRDGFRNMTVGIIVPTLVATASLLIQRFVGGSHCWTESQTPRGGTPFSSTICTTTWLAPYSTAVIILLIVLALGRVVMLRRAQGVKVGGLARRALMFVVLTSLVWNTLLPVADTTLFLNSEWLTRLV